MKKFKFPNGFGSWIETHFEVVSMIEEALKDSPHMGLIEYYAQNGRTGLQDLARSITQEFENRNYGRTWDGEFLEEVWTFTLKKINAL